jgi:hypothetical protein
LSRPCQDPVKTFSRSSQDLIKKAYENLKNLAIQSSFIDLFIIILESPKPQIRR